MHNELRVYRYSYDFLLSLYQLSSKFSKEYKYTLGESIKNEALYLLLNIYQANNSFADRKDNLNSSQKNLEKIRVFLRVLKDLKQIDLKKFVFLNQAIDSIGRQLTAWCKKT